MKKRSTLIFALFISLCSLNTFAQGAPGDSGDGSGTVAMQPSPLSFKRNNGNDICGSAAEIRVYFGVLPGYLPTIAQIRYEQRDVTGVVVSKVDASEFAKKGFVSYCVSSADVLPAVKLTIRFHYEKSNQDFWIMEGLNPTGRLSGGY